MHTNLNMVRYTLPMTGGVAPKSADDDRGHWDIADNTTASVRDAYFPKERDDHINAAKTKKVATGPLKVQIATQEKAAILTNQVARLSLNRAVLTDHLEDRVSSFLVQIVDCYDTDLHFTIGVTENQTESTSKAILKMPAGFAAPAGGDEVNFASAHHGTLPCIYAYPRTEWDVWKLKGSATAAGKPEPIVYMKNTDTYYNNNACTGLEKVINQADIDVDGNVTEKQVEFPSKIMPDNEIKLRQYTIELLNKASRKEIDPLEGFNLFMNKLEATIDILAVNLTEPEKKEIFRVWKEHFQGIKTDYQADQKSFIAKLLGIHIPRTERDCIQLDDLIFPRRLSLLKLKNQYISKLNAKITGVRSDILEGTAKTPKNFDKAFKVAVIKEAAKWGGPMKKLVDRFYVSSSKMLEHWETTCTKPALELVAKESSQKIIKTMFSEWNKYVHNFSVDESRFEGDLVKQIRETQKISLRKFADIYNQEFPNVRKLNYEQLRRIEGGHVKIDAAQIERFAAVLKVNKNALIAGFCNNS